MNYQYLYNLATLLDFEEKYNEADIVFDQMLRLADKKRKYFGQDEYYGRKKPRIKFNPMPGRAPVAPAAPVEAPVPQQPATPAATPAAPVQTTQNSKAPRKFYDVRDPKTGRFIRVPVPKVSVPYEPAIPNNSNILELNKNVAPQVKAEPMIGPQQYQQGFRPLSDNVQTQPKTSPKSPKNVPKLNMNPYDLKRKYYWDVWRGAIKNPDLRRALVLEAEMGRFFPETGDFIEGTFNPKPIKEFTPGKSPTGKIPGSGAGGANPNASSTNNTGAGARPRGPGGSPNTGGASVNAGPKPEVNPIPKDFNPNKAGANAAKYRFLILQNPGQRPEVAAKLELLVKKGLLDPKTGNWTRNFDDDQLSALEKFYRNFNKAQNAASDAASVGSKAGQAGAGAGSFSPASFARTLTNTKAGQNLVKALYSAQKSFQAVVSKIPPPALKFLSKIKFVFIFLNFARFIQALLNGTLEYKQTIEFIAACASISPQVLAALGSIPIVGPGLVIAVGAINFGAADVVEFFANPEAGLNYMGIQITGPSMRRKTDEIDFRTVDISKLDPAVQATLKESIPLIQSGKKISEILTDQGLTQRHPWLVKRDDIRFTQFSGALGAGGFYKQYKQQSPQEATQENQNTNYLPGTNPPKNNRQQGSPVYNNREQGQSQTQQSQQLKSHNDLLYKAYVDTVRTTNVTLENLKNYRDQIITKINNLAPMYPNINAQQAITALDNRIRKYSAQVQPA